MNLTYGTKFPVEVVIDSPKVFSSEISWSHAWNCMECWVAHLWLQSPHPVTENPQPVKPPHPLMANEKPQFSSNIQSELLQLAQTSRNSTPPLNSRHRQTISSCNAMKVFSFETQSDLNKCLCLSLCACVCVRDCVHTFKKQISLRFQLFSHFYIYGKVRKFLQQKCWLLCFFLFVCSVCTMYSVHNHIPSLASEVT